MSSYWKFLIIVLAVSSGVLQAYTRTYYDPATESSGVFIRTGKNSGIAVGLYGNSPTYSDPKVQYYNYRQNMALQRYDNYFPATGYQKPLDTRDSRLYYRQPAVFNNAPATANTGR